MLTVIQWLSKDLISGKISRKSTYQTESREILIKKLLNLPRKNLRLTPFWCNQFIWHVRKWSMLQRKIQVNTHSWAQLSHKGLELKIKPNLMHLLNFTTNKPKLLLLKSTSITCKKQQKSWSLTFHNRLSKLSPQELARPSPRKFKTSSLHLASSKTHLNKDLKI